MKKVKLGDQQGQHAQLENCMVEVPGADSHTWSSDEEDADACTAIAELELEVKRLHAQVGFMCKAGAARSL